MIGSYCKVREPYFRPNTDIVILCTISVAFGCTRKKTIIAKSGTQGLLNIRLLRACNLTAFTHSLTSPVVNPLLPSWGTRVQSLGGYLCETGILLLAMSCYIGDPDVIDHGGLRSTPSLGHCPENVIIPLDLTQLICPGFTLAAGPPSGFTTDIVGCWGGALWRACNLTTFTVGQPFASRHEGPGFNPQGILMRNWDSPVSDVSLQDQPSKAVHLFLGQMFFAFLRLEFESWMWCTLS
jgi:hypothetical protein